jgi:enoyl-CoA hydratase/carnithine racemase
MHDFLYEVSDGIAWIRLNRPNRFNSFDSEELQAYVDKLQEASDDPNVKVIILSSVGEIFCAGEDLKRAQREHDMIVKGELHPVLDIIEDVTENLQEIPRIIRKARKAVIASVRGYAVGGGFEIAMDCDMIVAAETAIFGFPEAKTGMTITGGASKLLPMIIGLNRSRELLMTGEFMNAEEAHRYGLVNKLVPKGQDEAEAERLARLIMTRSPYSVVNHKRLVNNAVESGFEAALEAEKQTITGMLYSEDYGEAIAAFNEKRDPVFHGR